MNDSVKQTVQTLASIACVVLLVLTLSAIAVVRADDRDPELVAAGGDSSSGQTIDGGTGVTPGSGDGGGAEETGGDPSAPSGGDQSSGGDAGGDPAAPGGGGESTQPGGAPAAAPSGGTSCPDYNPDEGVYCDRWLVGGTTILSGPLAIYGEAGLKGGQAWIQYFREKVAPEIGVRPGQLVFYDDNLEPNKTRQFVEKMVEVDKVLLIGGVTNPGAVGDYLTDKGVAFIGDLGLNPGSYTSPAIFPTSAPFSVSFELRAITAKKEGAKSITVIQDVLPASDPKEFEQLWEDAAKRQGVELKRFQPIDSQANSCDSKMLTALQDRADWIMLPVAAGPMLACMREAATQQARPGSPVAPNLINWSGGSNLQFEVDQCGAQCYGMYSAGTPFLDPRSNPHPNAKAYVENMARYAPGIDVTGFIPINYYHAGLLQFEVMKQAGITGNLSRKNVLEAADGFGPFETGFGNTVEWKTGQLPRVPTTCGYEVILDEEKRQWVFQDERICL
jgi:ABC-type branched-subunit amino acid transport system substrate-binding protein